MARINIEDSLFRDPRYIELVIAMGSRHAALGAVFESFMVAQEFYLQESTARLIPLAEWRRRKLADAVIDVGLAEVMNELDEPMVYVCGSEKQFAWLLGKQEAGRKGGLSKSPAKIKHLRQNQPKDDRSTTEAEPKHTEAPPKALPLTLPLSQEENTQESTFVDSFPVAQKKRSGDKAIRETVRIENPSDIPKFVKPEIINRWHELYAIDYVEREFLKIANYLATNPRKNLKTRRGWGQFVSTWLDKGWPKHQAAAPGQATSGVDAWLRNAERGVQ